MKIITKTNGAIRKEREAMGMGWGGGGVKLRAENEKKEERAVEEKKCRRYKVQGGVGRRRRIKYKKRRKINRFVWSAKVFWIS